MKISGLYLVTPNFNKTRNFYETIDRALSGGVDILEYNDTVNDENVKKERGLKLKKIVSKYNKPLTVYEDINLMDEIDLDGVHFSHSDLSIDDAISFKKKYKNKVLGVSINCDANLAIEYKKAGVDYISFGLCHKSNTNKVANICTLEDINTISKIDITKFAVGGMNRDNIHELSKYNFNGIVVVSAIFLSIDPKKSAGEIKKELLKRNID